MPMPGQPFPNCLLEEGIVRTHAWEEALAQLADLDDFRWQALGLPENAAGTHTINLASKVVELILPLLKLLGWHDPAFSRSG